MIWEIGSIAKHLVLPPVGLGWLVVLAWFTVRRRPALARWLLFGFLASAYALASGPLPGALIRMVEMPTEEHRFEQAQAIVILSGGRRLAFGPDGAVLGAAPTAFTLERLHGGAAVARRTGLPVLVSSGNPDGLEPTEAEVMRRILEEDFGVAPRWLEDRSRNTAENAELTARMLLPQGIRRVILVTSAFHMRRARMLFERAGFDVISASVNPSSPPQPLEWRDFVPSAGALSRSYYAFNEIGGMAYGYLRTARNPAATSGN